MLERALVNQLDIIHYTAHKNLADVTREESLVAPLGGGNCINWVLGHVVYSRIGIARALGAKPLVARERTAIYERGAAALDAIA